MSPDPSAGMKPGICSMGASGNFSASVAKGEAPMRSGPSCKPAIMEIRNHCDPAMIVMTGASQARFVRISTRPRILIKRIQRRNDPSCPAQKDETRK